MGTPLIEWQHEGKNIDNRVPVIAFTYTGLLLLHVQKYSHRAIIPYHTYPMGTMLVGMRTGRRVVQRGGSWYWGGGVRIVCYRPAWRILCLDVGLGQLSRRCRHGHRQRREPSASFDSWLAVRAKMASCYGGALCSCSLLSLLRRVLTLLCDDCPELCLAGTAIALFATYKTLLE